MLSLDLTAQLVSELLSHESLTQRERVINRVEEGVWVGVENAVVGPMVAILSFVCSVGNIPLAAVLWSGGSSFGGVVAFIFADLITIPMILVYRRYYGWKFALSYGALLLGAIVVTGLLIEGLFYSTGLAPDPAQRAGIDARSYFAWDYTTFLNLVFVPAGLAFFWLGLRKRSPG